MSETLPPNNTEAVYEMFWRCEFCGTDKLLGKTQRFCPNCGAPQATANRYFPSEEDRIAVQNASYQGVDITCPACNTATAIHSVFCTQCGSSLNAAAPVKLKSDTVVIENTIPVSKRSPLGIIVVCVMLAGLSYYGVDYFWRKAINLQLISAQWQKEIKIEQFQAINESQWCDSMPADAYAVSRNPEVKSHKKVPDGQSCQTERTDKGDGTFTTKENCKPKYRDEPVYADKCSYTVNRWHYKRSLIAQGFDKQPYEPELTLVNPGSCLGCEREAEHVAKYILKFNNAAEESEPVICEVPLSLWQQAVLPSKWQMEVGVMSATAHCATLTLVEKP